MATAERTRRPVRFGLLLALLITTYLFSAFISGGWIEAVQVALFVVAALLAFRDSPLRGRVTSLVVAAALAVSAIAFVFGLWTGDRVILGVISIWGSVLLLVTVVLIVRGVMSLTSVTVQSIYGAVSAYLLIGFMFAMFFGAINHLGGDHFFAHGQPADTRTLQYFSFTTLTTLGYGDFTAARDSGQAVAVLEALVGQVFLATLVARLVSAYGTNRGSESGD